MVIKPTFELKMAFARIRFILPGLLVILLLLPAKGLFAQSKADQARAFVAEKKYDKAIELFSEVYSATPDSVYQDYLKTLIAAKKYKQAEQLVEKQMTLRNNPLLAADMGFVYENDGKPAKARVEYDKLVNMVNGDFMFTDKLVKAFTDLGNNEYAIKVYERTGNLIGANFYFSIPLAVLYAKTGDLGKAIDALLVSIPGQGTNVEAVKATLLELLGNNEEKLQQMQKALVLRINEHPDNMYYVELLTWIFTQKNDWDGALMQMEAIDERNKENGKHLMELARTAHAAKQYQVAQKAYDDIIAKGKESPYFILSRSERLTTELDRIRNNPANTTEEINALVALYDSFLADYPKYYCQQAASDFATLLALYAGNIKRAITVLQKGVDEPDAKRSMVGQFKLQMGDYLVLNGKIWDASLVYSQVDKEFKQDALAEDARFRNAKLAYYRGDFEWAQRQLTILKTATSQLIANDAIYLSVLITENVEDSDIVPLQRFAYAGLLFFQNKDNEATEVLDSINKAYPKHPLNDDILMVRADMAVKHHQYDKALDYLKSIYEQYKEDVLGDDAVFKMAEIYQNNLHQNDKAKNYYEQLIIDYQGSTFVQVARQRLADMVKASMP
jgi:tetratricopeptide (TPR) repeat protein